MILEPIQCSSFLLRPVNLERDKEAHIQGVKNPKVAKWLTVRLPYRKEDWQQFVNYCERINSDDRSFMFEIEINGQAIGNVVLNGGSKYHNKHVGTFGYFLIEEYWGQGIMTETIKTLSELAFNKYDFKKLIIPTIEGNVGSQKVAEKNGFKYAYTDEKSICKDGKNYLNMKYFHKFNNI